MKKQQINSRLLPVPNQLCQASALALRPLMWLGPFLHWAHECLMGMLSFQECAVIAEYIHMKLLNTGGGEERWSNMCTVVYSEWQQLCKDSSRGFSQDLPPELLEQFEGLDPRPCTCKACAPLLSYSPSSCNNSAIEHMLRMATQKQQTSRPSDLFKNVSIFWKEWECG